MQHVGTQARAAAHARPLQTTSRRITRRGKPPEMASVVPMTRNSARSNIDLVPTNAMVRFIRPGGSTG